MEDEPPQSKEEIKLPIRRVLSQARGKYIVINNDKDFSFEFPLHSTLLENYEILGHLKEEVAKAIETMKEKEAKEKESEKPDCCCEKECECESKE